MKVGFPPPTTRRTIVKTSKKAACPVIVADAGKIDELLRLGAKGMIALHKMLRPEKDGGIGQDQRKLRKQIWDRILAHSFGGVGNIRVIEKDQLPYNDRLEHVRALGHVVLKGRLGKDGGLEAGRLFTKVEGYGHAEYLLEVNEGIPVRLFILSDHSAFEFFPIVDNKTGKVIDAHRGKVKKEHLAGLGDVTTYTYLSRVGGELLLGGLRAKFVNHPDEKVKVVIKDGLVHRCTSLESGLDVEFALVWDKRQGRYISSFWGKLFESELNELNENHEIHNFLLSRDGSLYMGARQWIDFGPRYSYKPARITDIRNPSGRKAFIVGAEVVEDGRVLASKKLSLIYEVPENSPPASFERAGLFNVFEKWSADKLVRADGTRLNTYIIAGIRLYADGGLLVNGYWGRFTYFAGAEVEAKVIDGKPAYIKFIADKKGNPILDIEDRPLKVELGQNNGENGIKRQILTRSKLFRQRRTDKLASLFAEGVRLFTEGKRVDAKIMFRKVLRMIERTPAPSMEMREIAEKTKAYFVRERKPVQPKPPKPTRPVPESKPEPKPKPAPTPPQAPKPPKLPKAPKPSDIPSRIRGFIRALEEKGGNISWLARESGITEKRLQMISAVDFLGSKEELVIISTAYTRFIVWLAKIGKLSRTK
jgi:hypothetical protein